MVRAEAAGAQRIRADITCASTGTDSCLDDPIRTDGLDEFLVHDEIGRRRPHRIPEVHPEIPVIDDVPQHALDIALQPMERIVM